MKPTQSTEWRRLRSEPGPELKIFRVRFDDMRNPRNQAEERMIILEAEDSANVVALTPAQEILFVRQYRFGIGAETVELPGGFVDPGEPPLQGAQRELQEETGYTGTRWHYLGKFPSNPVFMDSWIHHWMVQQAEFVAEPKLDDGEAVELVKMPVAEVRRKLSEGYFLHPHTVTGLVLFFAVFEDGSKMG